MRQITKIKHISLRFVFSLESDIDDYKISLRDKKDGTKTVFQNETFNNALVEAHNHFKETMKAERSNNRKNRPTIK